MRIIEAYEILTRRQINEDRLVAERLTVGCLVNSILLVAFFTATQTTLFSSMRIILPLSGLVFSFALVALMCISSFAMISYYNALHKLEQESAFTYMKEHGVRPFTDLSGTNFGKTHVWKLGFYVAPLFTSPFIVIWIFLLFG